MTNNPFGSNPFETVFKDLLKAMASQADLAGSIAEQFAMSVVSSETNAANPDPLGRMKIDSLFDIAQRNLTSDSMISEYLASKVLHVATVSQLEYVQILLRDLSPLIAKLESLSKTSTGDLDLQSETSQMFAGLPLAQMSAMIGPFMSGMNVGSCVGHLAQETFATFDVILPRQKSDIAIIYDNLEPFASAWNLNLDELILWISLQQITTATLLSLPHIAKIVNDAIDNHLNAALLMSQSLTKRLENLDMSDPNALESLTSDPTQLIGIELSENQEFQMRNTAKALAVIVGMADYITSTAARRLLGNFEQITEALRRRRLEQRSGEELFGNIFGINLNASAYEIGHKFIFGVVERDDENKLSAILQSPLAFPTPNEVDAPGLWLARLETMPGNSK